MSLHVLQEGLVYRIENDAKQRWLGPEFSRERQWGEPNYECPCWMTTSREAALCQAALLEANPEPSIWELVAAGLSNEAEEFRNAKEHRDTAYAVAVAMEAASQVILKALKVHTQQGGAQ